MKFMRMMEQDLPETNQLQLPQNNRYKLQSPNKKSKSQPPKKRALEMFGKESSFQKKTVFFKDLASITSIWGCTWDASNRILMFAKVSDA